MKPKCKLTDEIKTSVQVGEIRMDHFLNMKTCDRCGGSLESGRIMSMLNEACICLSCKEKELKDPEYDVAVKADHNEIKKGNYNFKGIRGK